MIDHANYRIAQGQPIAIQRAQGVNDNMKKPHYHEFYELYYLESGSRIHMADDLLLRIGPGDFLLFPPYSMHYSYGEKDMPFQRLSSRVSAPDRCQVRPEARFRGRLSCHCTAQDYGKPLSARKP